MASLSSYYWDFVPATLNIPVAFCIFNSTWTWLAGEITGNVSQVDRVWTFLPTIYAGFFAFYPLTSFAPDFIKVQGVNPRNVLMFALQVIWMTRLSYNTWRRGLFRLTDEDYRWVIVRDRIPAWMFSVLNLTFIAIIQNVLLFSLNLPAHTVLLQPHTPLNLYDLGLSVLTLTLILTEFVTDNQQYSFQTFKQTGKIEGAKEEWPGARIQWTEDDKKRGFVTRGLWAYSRHPAFACEQLIWATMAFFPILQGPLTGPTPADRITPLWPLVPPLSLCVLFASSTHLTEAISASKYPRAYAAYQQRVGMFSPVVTAVKGVWLAVRGSKARADELVWGDSTKQFAGEISERTPLVNGSR